MSSNILQFLAKGLLATFIRQIERVRQSASCVSPHPTRFPISITLTRPKSSLYSVFPDNIFTGFATSIEGYSVPWRRLKQNSTRSRLWVDRPSAQRQNPHHQHASRRKSLSTLSLPSNSSVRETPHNLFAHAAIENSRCNIHHFIYTLLILEPRRTGPQTDHKFHEDAAAQHNLVVAHF